MKKLVLGLLVGAVLASIFLARGGGKRPTRVTCVTTKGPLTITVHPEWSPRGAERFLRLVDDRFYSGLPLFRCMSGFLCQFGAKPGGTPYTTILDDPPRSELRAFRPGYLSFAGFGPNSRSTHVFVALSAAASLGTQPWETPFGEVSDDSMQTTVSRWNTRYGDHGPDPRKIEAADGETYVRKDFPDLDWFTSCARD